MCRGGTRTYPDMYKVASKINFGPLAIHCLSDTSTSILTPCITGRSGHHWKLCHNLCSQGHGPQLCDVLKNFHSWCRIEHFYFWAGMLACIKQIFTQYLIPFFPLLEKSPTAAINAVSQANNPSTFSSTWWRSTGQNRMHKIENSPKNALILCKHGFSGQIFSPRLYIHVYIFK